MSSYAPSQRLIERLAEEIRVAGQQHLMLPNDAEMIARALLGHDRTLRAELLIPTQVVANVKTRLADLEYVRCVRCGQVYNAKTQPSLLKNSKCPKCGGSLVAVPLWVITARSVKPANRRITPNQGIELTVSIETYTKTHIRNRNAVVPKQIHIGDRSRPIATLEFIYGFESHNPAPVHKHKVFKYMLALMPSESITKPVTITAFAYNDSTCVEVNTTTGFFSGVSKVLYCKNMEILQATLLHKAGHQRSSSRSRVAVLDMSQSQLGGAVVRIPVRYIQTQGLVVKVDENSVKNVLKELDYSDDDVWIALHTISHAFLVSLPQITGLEGADFGEAISTSTKEIAVYDNSFGGLGGIEGIVDTSGGVLTPNYEWSVRESYKCPLACTKACKACLFTDSCFMLNWRLDRRILERLGW
ncbi:MAG: hypothetical protein B7O98_02625 [Zestosphaera tikiterensis]|uniref:Uncharacterized protein n=1 Tax=Zestosphaera tikiterensis TaxID=1973259 RepID=A0A2R7Y7P3_9CREN|nr:MAG: hypothetical protein B7O98_02625 [Zestosphaera tikiterensis]